MIFRGFKSGGISHRRDKDFREDVEGGHTGAQQARGRVRNKARRTADVSERTPIDERE